MLDFIVTFFSGAITMPHLLWLPAVLVVCTAATRGRFSSDRPWSQSSSAAALVSKILCPHVAGAGRQEVS
jgi:hypothetical protein